jgi:hypothetical protein
MSDSLTSADNKKRGLELRKNLHSAYAFVRGVETNKSMANLDLEHLIKEHVDTIKSTKAGGTARAITDYKNQSYGERLTKIDMLDALKESMGKVVDTLSGLKDDPEALKAMGLYETPQEMPDEFSSSADQQFGFDALTEATSEDE